MVSSGLKRRIFQSILYGSIALCILSWLLLWIWNGATDQYPTGFAAGWLALFAAIWGITLARHLRQKVSDGPPVGLLFSILYGVYFALSGLIYFVVFVALAAQDALGTGVWAALACAYTFLFLFVWARKERRRQEDFDELADFNETRCSAPVVNLIKVLLCYSFLFFELTTMAQVIGAAIDSSSISPPGALFDVADRDELTANKMHIHCVGPANQDPAVPTVVFESAIAAPGISWGLVQDEIAKVTTACIYDRKGYGWSWRGANPRHVEKFSEELNELLTIAEVSRPFVGVGWGFGSLILQKYADVYGYGFQANAEVQGLVFVDALNPTASVASAEDSSSSSFVDDEFFDSSGPSFFDHFIRYIIPLGFIRMAEQTSVSAGSLGFPFDVLELLGESRFNAYRAFLLGYYHSNTVVQEKRSWKTTSLDDVDGLFAPGYLGDLPVAVVSRTSTSDAYNDAQEGLEVLSNNSRSSLADAESFLPMQDPATIVDAIIDTLARSVIQYQADAIAGDLSGLKRTATSSDDAVRTLRASMTARLGRGGNQ